MTKLNLNEQLVLRYLSGVSDGCTGGFGYCSFANIVNGIRDAYLTRKEIRRACRSLKRKGLTEFATALWSDYGPAGAGYAATRAGKDCINTWYPPANVSFAGAFGSDLVSRS